MHLKMLLPLAAGLAMLSTAAAAQVDSGCTRARVGGPPREVFRCANGLVIDVEAASRMGLAVDDNGPRDLTLERGAVYVEARPGARFQILTPVAIAAVRGTEFAVDAGADGTSVFVVEGRVRVTKRRLPGAAVELGPGEGVDVRRSEPLVVRTWGAARVRALLARFGR